ncbi:tetratricopeptide repeat protein [Chitinibacter bivalviorum]|uniref:Ancillary SecYEG translocon subunit n=1 Tax=Chitinibacter bivalviorum TaxID=2739434 RepID=A0A7H9BIV8_9NEIS|nr:tetratricopeptide repeat protein [Chitinibacter bivalviorum]QLG87921.1 tetratricopeptide repeat protein [Chitinibacter bivalviorum]
MAAFDLQEQEQIAELKAWWQSWGQALALVLGAALIAYAAWTGWQTWQKRQVAQAAEIYAQMQAQGMDEVKFNSALSQLKTEYSSTPYSSRAALAAAKMAYMKGNPVKATTELNWVISNSKEVTLRDTAKLRLAGILMDGQKYDEALALIKTPEEESYSALFAEMRGDLMVAKKDNAAAADAYRQAIAKLPKDAPNLKLVEVKLDVLGVK